MTSKMRSKIDLKMINLDLGRVGRDLPEAPLQGRRGGSLFPPRESRSLQIGYLRGRRPPLGQALVRPRPWPGPSQTRSWPKILPFLKKNPSKNESFLEKFPKNDQNFRRKFWSNCRPSSSFPQKIAIFGDFLISKTEPVLTRQGQKLHVVRSWSLGQDRLKGQKMTYINFDQI